MKTIKKGQMSVAELMMNTIIEYFERIGITQKADIMRNIMRWNHEDIEESEDHIKNYYKALMTMGNLVIAKISQKLSETSSIDKDYIDMLCCIDRMKDYIPFDIPNEVKTRWEDLALEYGDEKGGK